MRFNTSKFFIAVLLSLVWIIFSCRIIEVSQPDSADPGQTITVTVSVVDDILPETNPNKGVLSILVPDDWSFVSGTYQGIFDGTQQSGVLEESTEWTDSTENCLPAGGFAEGMKWIGLISDQGFTYSDTLLVQAEVELQVGQNTGIFALGYLTTKATEDVICNFTSAWSDTSMNHLINVGAVGIVETQLPGLASAFSLEQNYPNPFNPSTTIRYQLSQRGEVKLAVYDLTGREVEVLVRGVKQPGIYEVHYSAENLASGIYIYRLTAGNFVQTRKMVFTR